MAYNDPKTQLGLRVGASFNQAAQLTAARISSGQTLNDDDVVLAVADLAADLFEAAETLQLAKEATLPAKGSSKPAPAAKANVGGTPAEMLRDELGAMEFPESEPSQGVQIVNDQAGPLPPWFVAAAASVGCTKAWDNRQEAAGNRKPHFRAADGTVFPDDHPKYAGQPYAFWPPSNR